MGRFNKGLVLGGLLGAALVWLNATPKGKELRAKIKMHIDPLYAELKESLSQLDGPTREMYDALVERAVEEYAAKRELALDVKNMLVRELHKRWEQLEKELKVNSGKGK
jgi:gas vesicle protein